jgi:hypothetical protein
MSAPLKSLTLSILPVCFASSLFGQQIGSVGDWPDWRGPERNGVSQEKGLPEKWTLAGQNLAWKAPYGGRSTPVILGDHLYLQNTSSSGENEQERHLLPTQTRKGPLGI